MQVKLSETTPTILTFDGQVLECFFDEGGSKRIHVTHLKSIHLDAQGHGKRLLTIQLKLDQLFLSVDEAIVPQVNELLVELQKNMQM